MTVLEEVQKYYGETLTTNDDLKTGACCSPDAIPAHIKPLISLVHPEVQEKFYGCGSPIPPALNGMRVLDLGCGTGRDCFVMSSLVGEKGQVVGVDMTPGQLAVANAHIDYHRSVFDLARPNVEFHEGYIEDLGALGIEDESVDVVTSNCVLNLSPDKSRVFKEIFRVLKPGGELFFSDIFSMQRIPGELVDDPVLRGECLGGALYIEDFRRLLLSLGINDYRIITQSRVTVDDPALAALVGDIEFYSMTIRVFNISLEDRCEDYGQVAWYLGGIEGAEHAFVLDDHHVFKRNKPMLVCSNTARMLSQSRFAANFRMDGDESHHFGLFDCASPGGVSENEASVGACC